MTLDNSSHQISLLLIDWSKGDEYALEQLMPLVYHELRLMARRHMRRQPSGHTFQTTDLIQEAYLKIAGGEERNWQSRNHFLVSRQKRCGTSWLITRGLKITKNAVAGRKG